MLNPRAPANCNPERLSGPTWICRECRKHKASQLILSSTGARKNTTWATSIRGLSHSRAQLLGGKSWRRHARPLQAPSHTRAWTSGSQVDIEPTRDERFINEGDPGTYDEISGQHHHEPSFERRQHRENVDEEGENEQTAAEHLNNYDNYIRQRLGKLGDEELTESCYEWFARGTIQPALDKIDYRTRWPHALQAEEPHWIAACLLAAARANDGVFLQSISQATFSHCIRLLCPQNFVPDLMETHLSITPHQANSIKLKPMRSICQDLRALLTEVVVARQRSGMSLTLSDYTMLLEAARDLGQRAWSSQIWESLSGEDFAPDVACYNYMMDACLSNARFQAATPRQRIRVIPLHMYYRERRASPFSDYWAGPGGLKSMVLDIFRAMLKQGVIANEESYSIVLMAGAREGDLALVRSLLRKIWGVEVESLMAGAPEESIPVKSFDSDSPLRPTSRLLFAVTHSFCINNDLPAALRVTDFLCRKYDIAVDNRTWAQLFEWASVLSLPRIGRQSKADGSKTGALYGRSLMSLWETMTGPPYHVQPTMTMYNQLLKNLANRARLPQFSDKMVEGVKLYLQTKDTRIEAKRALRAALADPTTHPASLPSLRRKWEQADVRFVRDARLIRRWVRLLCSSIHNQEHDPNIHDHDWSLRELPRISWDLMHHCPRNLRYWAAAGRVEFELHTVPPELETARRYRGAAEYQRLRRAVPLLFGDDWRVRALPQKFLPRTRDDLDEMRTWYLEPSSSESLHDGKSL